MSAARNRGLPARLPEGERLLWQGSPAARSLAHHLFRIGGVAVYFAVILAFCAVTEWRHGWTVSAIGMASLHKAGFALVPVVLIAAYAWGIERCTVYSITSRRMVFSIGIALPMSFNIPFARIEGAGLRRFADGSGDIPVQLGRGDRVSYAVFWPHARPWRLARPEPMLRGISNVAEVSAILARALSAHVAAQAAGEAAVQATARARASVSASAGLAVAAE